MDRAGTQQRSVSVVIPVLNEGGCVDGLVERLRSSLTKSDVDWDLLFVDDGSTDGTRELIEKQRAMDPRIKAVYFTRTFGHQAALVAGLAHARGDAVVTMDGDLQHPPELVPLMIAAWLNGADVVQAVRRAESGGPIKRYCGPVFYRVMKALTRIPIVPSSADFRLMDRRVVKTFNDLQEHFVFVRGLVPWMGFHQVEVPYAAEVRGGGRSKFGFRRMLRLAFDGILSFSILPLRFITVLGFMTTVCGVLFGALSLVSWARGRVDGSGWTSLVLLILIFGGVQLLSIGILSEYVGRTYEEAKRRPRYVIDEKYGTDRQ